jgi:hypothetical protein
VPLTSLILRKGYEAIVQDIIDEAALRASWQRRAARPNINGSRDEPLGFSLAMFEHASAYTDIYRALVGGRGGGVAVNEIRRILLRRR